MTSGMASRASWTVNSISWCWLPIVFGHHLRVLGVRRAGQADGEGVHAGPPGPLLFAALDALLRVLRGDRRDDRGESTPPEMRRP